MAGTMPVRRAFRQPMSHSSWFDTPIALELLSRTQRQAGLMLTSHIGVRGLYLRPTVKLSPMLSGNMLQQTASLHSTRGGFAGDLDCAESELPFENDSLCLLYVQHALDVALDPEALLSECARVLRPEGVMFVSALSLASPWRLRWGGSGVRPIAQTLLQRRLKLEGLTVESAVGLGPVWPMLNDRTGDDTHAQPSHWVPDPLRATMTLVARKRRHTMTPLPQRGAQAVGSAVALG